MCDVCVAENVLKAGTKGENVGWTPRAGYEGSSPATPAVFMRAKGRGAELKPAEYQIRKAGNRWPKAWTRTNDLAGVVCWYGFDTRWSMAPKRVKDWLTGKRRMPKFEEVR